MVENIDATSSYFTINCCELSVDDVIPHEQSILLSPVPRGVELMSFEGVKGREDTIDVEITMLAADSVQTHLENEKVGLFFEIAGTGVLLEVTGVKFNLLACSTERRSVRCSPSSR